MKSYLNGQAVSQPAPPFADIIRYYPDPAFAIDRHGHMIAWNEAIAQKIGGRVENSAANRRHCYDLLHHRTTPCADCPILQATTTGNPRQAKIIAPDDRSWFLRWHPVPDGFGKHTHFIVFMQEMTDCKRTEARLLESVQDLPETRPDTYVENWQRDLFHQREKRLRHYIGLHQLIARISTRLANATASDIDVVIERMLAEVAIFTGVDRSYLFQYSSDMETASNTHEWCAENVKPRIQNLKYVQCALHGWWMQKMSAGEHIVLQSVQDLPPEAQAEKAFLQAQQIRSLIAVPVKCGKLIGFLGFDCVYSQKIWNDVDKQLLQTIAEMVGTMILREQESDALRRSERRFRLFMDSNLIGVVFADPVSGRVSEANDEYLRIIGRSRDDLRRGKINWKEITPAKFLATERRWRESIPAENHFLAFEKEYLRPDGQRVPVIVGGLVDEGRQWAVAYAMDITERKKAEHMLQKAHDALEQQVEKRTAELEKRNSEIKDLAHKTIIAMENDRKALSKELHDSVCGTLAAIKYQLEGRIEVMGTPPESIFMPLERIVDYLGIAITESKRITKQLRPSLLDDLGLTAAVDQCIRDYEQFHPKMTVLRRISIAEVGLTSDVKIVLYRVLQEALNNVGKHSHADEVYIRCHRYKGQVKLKIKDNGIGFDPVESYGAANILGGYGLHSMKERVEICNGEFRIESVPGKGTTILASIPT
ncbi:MAG: hypothetical protein VR64_16655 [Desulfatitalea sp. BRH_c12]|nr:MAG: hypothetical protein VR64_16655 [Desulfatitalea sp. BRH_c12]